MTSNRRRGPVPKRANQRRRTNKPATGELQITTAPASVDTTIPAGNDNWHPIAADWYASLAKSGQSAFYEPSDWQVARYVAEAMSRSLTAPKGMSAMMVAAVITAMGNLLTTEGDRRRLRMELERGVKIDPDADASVTAISEWQRKLGG